MRRLIDVELNSRAASRSLQCRRHIEFANVRPAEALSGVLPSSVAVSERIQGQALRGALTRGAQRNTGPTQQDGN